MRTSAHKLLILAFFLYSSLTLSAQKEMIIKFTPDDFPQDISWELQIQDDRKVVASGDLVGCTPNEECVVFQEMMADVCYTLLITDSNQDGIAAPGGYEMFFGDSLVVTGGAFDERIYHNLNCGKGEVCETAVIVKLPNPRLYSPNLKEYWYSFTVEESGHYQINTCRNTISGQGTLDTRLWYYNECNRYIQQPGAEGAAGFSDDASETDCPPGAGFNFVPMDAGETYYVKVKPLGPWININKDDSLQITIVKQPTRIGCNDPTACNYDPFTQVSNNTCFHDDACTPDLALDEEELRNTIEVDTIYNNDPCFIEEGCLRGPGPREVVRFSTKIDNIGDADYVVGRPEVDPQLFSRENCHGHYHHLGYAEYLLYRGAGQPEPVGFKSGFCVLDLDCSASGKLRKYQCNYMGISVGCSDIYEAALDCQWIDITDIPDGQYSIIVRINHFRLPDARGFQEKTFENNHGQACITIDRSSGKLVVTVDEECPEYMDCLGVPGGDAVVDCNGDCGGTAHFGDLDGSGELEEGDVAMFLDLLANKASLTGACQDVNADNQLSIYDAALMYECLQEKIEQAGNPFHDHCSFPAGSENPSETAIVRVTEVNDFEKYMDLEIWVSDRNIVAYQLATSGVSVTKVERLYNAEPDQLFFTDETVFAMHTDNQFERNTGYEPFLRIYFDEITSDSICVTNGSEFVNSNYSRVGLLIENACDNTVAVDDLITNNHGFSLVPNPAKNKIAIYAEGKNVEYLQILNVDGSLLRNEKVNTAQGFEVDISALIEGLYIMQLNFKDGKSATKRFMKAK